MFDNFYHVKGNPDKKSTKLWNVQEPIEKHVQFRC